MSESYKLLSKLEIDELDSKKKNRLVLQMKVIFDKHKLIVHVNQGLSLVTASLVVG